MPTALFRSANRAFSRSSSAPLVNGNRVNLLYDSTENFPAWLDAIESAQDSILIEMYIFSDDAFGKKLLSKLIEKAQAGVAIYLLYDWLGCWKSQLRGFFKPLKKAGAQVRAYNPISVISGLSILERDHRKQIIIDQKIAFISGLCISQAWEGNPKKDIAPWRDTGTKIIGPVVIQAVQAFVDSWQASGASFDLPLLPMIDYQTEGDIGIRLIAGTPATANMMRFDLLIAAFARKTLWITDAYFMGTGTYLTALKNAAQDGVDVRLLVPRSSDIAWIATVSRTQYRPLLQAGIRVFEWNGPMIHAKTAVADSRWARIGSSNLNLSSWLANRELDVSIEDETIATQMAQKFYEDLDNATEIILSGHKAKPILSHPREHHMGSFKDPSLQASRAGVAAARQAIRLSSTLGAAVRGTRSLDVSEFSALFSIATFLAVLAMLFAFFPYLLVGPVVFLMVASALVVLIKAYSLKKKNRGKNPIENTTRNNS